MVLAEFSIAAIIVMLISMRILRSSNFSFITSTHLQPIKEKSDEEYISSNQTDEEKAPPKSVVRRTSKKARVEII